MTLVFSRTGRIALAVALAVVATVSESARGQAPAPPVQGADLPQLYAQAMGSFNAGDYAKAATDLEALVGRAEFSPQLEPVFYTIGSAYFNAANYSKAIAAFKTYQAKFPSGPHAGDVLFALAQSSLATKNYPDAANQFAGLEKDPRFREQALLYQANALKEAGKTDEAAAALEKLAGGDTKTANGARGLMSLAQLYAKKGNADKAVQTLTKLREQVSLVDNIVELNAMTVELGDQLYAKKLYPAALECYRAAFPRAQIVRLQNERIATMQRTIENNLNAARADATLVASLGPANNQLKADITRAQKLLEEFGKLPDVTPAIYLRMASSFYESDRKWEAVVVYQELLDRFAAAPEREGALFGMIVALADVNQPSKAMTRGEEYLRDFPKGANAETVGYLLGAVALQANDPKAAETYFGKMLAKQPNSTYREQMRYLLGNAMFMAGKYEEANGEYKKFLVDFPKSQNLEDVTYRMGLTALFAGKYEEAMKQIGAFIQKYPQNAMISDARYRMAVCKYAASLYQEVITDCKAWERDYAGNQQLGEVLSLLADSYSATDREEQAIPIYIQAYKTASTEEVMNYSLFAASKLMQKRGEWNKVADLFTEFIRDKPDHPTVITALYWIGKAKAHEGQLEEAKRITADTIKKYIGDPQREAVEMLLTQLAQLCVKKKRADALPEGEASTVAVVADPGAELDRLLGESEKDQKPTARARILFAKAELARLRRQPQEEERNIGQLAENYQPQDLSPMLLGLAGDYLLNHHKADPARAAYDRLMEEFPKSDNVDFAYNGLGEIAFAMKDYPKALRYFTEAIEKIAAVSKLKDVTVGKAKTLLAMDRLQEAKKAFEQIAAVREWRGEATAFSIFSLGDIEARQGHWAEANAYFQRVYVGYQKFLPWVAKAYLMSAQSFEKLGKNQEAANTYRELLRNEKLATFVEADEARKKLAGMGQTG